MSEEGARPIRLVLLDVNETLTDLTPVADLFARAGAPGSLASRWLTMTLQTGFALSMAGTPQPFAEVAVAVLPRLLYGETLPNGRAQVAAAVVDRYRDLPLQPDVSEGLRALREAGVRVATLTNGSREYTRQLLERHNLLDVVEETLTVDDAPAWKPDPRAYRFALDRLQIDAPHVMMVSVHPWDLHGAAQVGMRTAWLDRSGAPYPAMGSAPDIATDSLPGLAAMLR